MRKLFLADRLNVRSLVIAAILLASSLAHADESKCIAYFKSFLPRAVKADPETYAGLRDKEISKYFPETEVVHPQPGTEVVGAKLTVEAKQSFFEDFDRLLDQRAAIFHMPAKEFREWLTAKFGAPYPSLDPLHLEQVFKAKGATIEDFQNAYFMAFAQEKAGKKNLIDYLKMLHPKEIGRFSLTLTRGISVGTFNILKGALVAGPVAGVVVAFLSAPLKPVQESSEQISNIVFTDVAQTIQSFMSSQVKKLAAPVTEIKETTHALDLYDFDKIDRKEAKKIMDQFEDRYYKIFLRLSGQMPSFKRAGRDVVRDWAIMQPVYLAMSASTFSMEYTMNQSLIVNLKEKIEQRGKPATEEEKLLLEQYAENMETAENRLAVTLASWKLLRFMFAEVAREPMGGDPTAVLTNTWQRYEKYMNMAKYKKELSVKIHEAFKNFDPSFGDLDKLEKQPEKKD